MNDSVNNPIMLAYGGGTNSTAIICGWIEKGLKPFDLILFADTGAEKPHTYNHIKFLNNWLPKYGMPQITIVRTTNRAKEILPLETDCLQRKTLPAIAFGFKSCSEKFKIRPQNKFCNHYKPFKDHWKAGGLVTRLIGYDFAETRRWMKAKVEDEKYRYQFPLVEWEWDRPACVAAIERMGVPLPGKSACFFCPSTKRQEIVELKRQYPDLYERAIAMEDAARPYLKSIKGLGRNYSWRDYMEGRMSQSDLFEADINACGYCVDFESE